MRVFCAIELPASVRVQIIEHIAKLRGALPKPGISWAREGALHITLKFLGEIESNRVTSLSSAVERAVRNASPFNLLLKDTGAFPAHGAPRVLWIGVVDPSGNLSKLYESLEKECSSDGFDREKRAFHPHLTIARQRSPQGIRTPSVLSVGSNFEGVEFPVKELVVMQSELRPEGSRYSVVSKHTIGA